MLRLHTLGGLWIEGDPAPSPLGPRRMGLLAIVAAAGRKGISRESVLGILWAEHAEEAARHTLAQHLYSLRRQTGRDVILATPELRLGPDITSDIGDLYDALSAEDDTAVVALYRGDFLQGYYMQGVPEFERWAEEERIRIRSAALRAHERLATRHEQGGDPAESLRFWRRLVELEPLSARYAAGTMRALAAVGDVPAAIAHARTHEELVRRELESESDPTVRELAAAMRRGQSSVPSRRRPNGGAERIPAPDVPSDSRPEPARDRVAAGPSRTAGRNGGVFVAAAVVLLALIGVASARALLRDERAAAPLLAVGSIRIVGAADSAAVGPVLRDMLATRLAGIGGLQIVANSRLVELAGLAGDTGAQALNDAARRAGAGEVLEGEVSFGPDGATLNLRRVALDQGVVRQGYVMRAPHRIALVDSVTFAIARDMGLQPPTGSTTALRTRSAEAYALYEEGLRAYFVGQSATTIRLMRAALEYDSAFAMAAFYAWQASRGQVLDEESRQLRALARRLAPRATEQDRLLIEGFVAEFEAPFRVTLAIAETLSVRYPGDPDGNLLLGNARFAAGDWAGAVSAYERVVRIDSAAGLSSTGAACRICAGFIGMANAYAWWDSAHAAERSARRLIAMRPDEASGWGLLIEPLLRQGRRAEAEEAARRAETISGLAGSSQFSLHRDLIRAGRYADLDRELTVAAFSASLVASSQARWLWLFALRDQGRLAEAMAMAQHGTIPGSDTRIEGMLPEMVHLAVIPFEAGRPLESAARFRRNAQEQRMADLPPGFKTRSVAWSLTLAGTALAAAGDTAGLRAIADTVEQIGPGSSFGRDPRLHHFLRGLLLQIQGRHDDAVAAFERSMFSTTDGYTRINLAMARSLLALGRASEAVAILQPVLRGGIDGSNTYVTRTEAHEALAEAFSAAGMPDSARIHYRAVEHALQHADPGFRPRYERARQAAASS